MPLIWLMRTNERTKQKTARRRTHWKEQKITHTNAKGRSEYVREKSLFVNDKENLEFKFSSIDCLSFHHHLSLALSLCVCVFQCVLLSVRVATHSHNSVWLYEQKHTNSHIFNGTAVLYSLPQTHVWAYFSVQSSVWVCISVCVCFRSHVYLRAWLLSDCNSCRWNLVSIKHLHDTLGYYKLLRANHSHFFTLFSQFIVLKLFQKSTNCFCWFFFVVCTKLYHLRRIRRISISTERINIC